MENAKILLDWITPVASIFSALAVILAAWKFSIAQNLKRSEFAAGFMDDFFKSDKVNNALVMLDWDDRKVKLFPEKQDTENRFVTVTDEAVIKALQPHIDEASNVRTFDETETAIRLCFDSLFARLSLLYTHLETGLIEKREVRPRLLFWIRILNGKQKYKSERYLNTLRAYVDFYVHPNVKKLIDNFEKK